MNGNEWATPPVRLGLSGKNSGKIPERPRKRSQSVSWNFPREYGWDAPSPIIQGIWGFQNVSIIVSPPVRLGTPLFPELVPERASQSWSWNSQQYWGYFWMNGGPRHKAGDRKCFHHLTSKIPTNSVERVLRPVRPENNLLRRSFPEIRAPQKGPEKWCRAKIAEKCRKTFWHFLTIFDVFCPARKLSKNFLTLFDTFWRFLTWPLSAGPFCNPLMKGFHVLRSPKSPGKKGSFKDLHV